MFYLEYLLSSIRASPTSPVAYDRRLCTYQRQDRELRKTT